MQNDQNCALQIVYQISKFATVFARFHSNRLLKTLTDGIFVFKSKQQCLLPKKSKFVALLTNLEISPAYGLKYAKGHMSLRPWVGTQTRPKFLYSQHINCLPQIAHLSAVLFKMGRPSRQSDIVQCLLFTKKMNAAKIA